ncbi:Protein strawberry notch homolog 1 [Durusdinium trenchii]|uniref:Protein strawberry notch homolog 1 n=1 Tax=Durusdinium trenchii TaxID=1381693 RepID=A0ABP0JPS4_9DINO
MAEGLSANASFLYNGVLQPQTDPEKARRFFPMLRKWAETGKEYRGQVFSSAEVEEAISAFEKSAAPRSVPSPQQKTQEFWPRWAMNKARGVEVLAPLKGKPTWSQATPVAIGYHGQKKCFLFVRSERFEMDCQRHEVRPVGGGRTAQQQLEDLISRGHRAENHHEWTDGSDLNVDDQNAVEFIRPGIAAPAKQSKETREARRRCNARCALLCLASQPSKVARICIGIAAHLQALEDEGPSHILHTSLFVDTRRACLRPELNESDALALPAVVAEERLSSLQLETVCFAARRFRTKLPDGRTAGYVLGDGTGCGKGRVISALLYHMWNSGHRRHPALHFDGQRRGKRLVTFRCSHLQGPFGFQRPATASAFSTCRCLHLCSRASA